MASELPFLTNTFVADPSGVDVAIAQLVKKLPMKFRLEPGITFIAETHDIFILPWTIEMWSSCWVACVWRLAWVISTLLRI